MQIRVGYELIYDCPQSTPMLLMLNVHYTRVSDMLVPDHLVASPSNPIRGCRDGFGNWCNRFVAPTGRIRLSAAVTVNDTGEPDRVASGAQQHSVEDLPDEVLVFLLGSRYCETDQLSDIAWSLFGKTPPGWSRLRSICDYVHQHLAFGYEHARATRTAWEASCDRIGVCRDYAPRGRSLPLHEHPGAVLHGLSGRYRRLRLGRADGFLSWFEAYLEAADITFDARHNIPRVGRVLITRGRDVADVAITTTFGPNTLSSFTVVTEEITAARSE